MAEHKIVVLGIAKGVRTRPSAPSGPRLALRLWRKVVTETFEKGFPDLKVEHQLIDNAAMIMVKNPHRPQRCYRDEQPIW
ncbi:hypothetical protein CDV31_016411 [Fusarium ambrosium]|uniref:Isopropylmalate dehydrogenase-like domain-containing protein n=1 Tax=Fusarium ambrosium TaxID=131363 RepID=A0A428S979_9HYPO|nr:hypothetical protein CDV31_016411 [Fusarium ambrosium]